MLCSVAKRATSFSSGSFSLFCIRLKLRARFHFRAIGYARLVGQCLKKKKPGDGRILYILADGVIALVLCLFSDKTRSFNQWKRSLHPKFIQNAN